jgi:hypothetical protein
MVDIATVDQTVSQQGQFCLLDWLLQENILAYADYEDWRYGRVSYLDAAFTLSSEEILRLIEQTQISCQQLKLAKEKQEFYRWDGDHRKSLLISAYTALHQALGQRWLPPQNIPQMDLFMDNSATIAENNVLELLTNRRFAQAQTAVQQLAQLNPKHGKLGGYQDLTNYGLHIAENSIIPREALLAELLGLDQEVAPLAKELLGGHQRDYLAFAWRRLAESQRQNEITLTDLNDEPRLHCSYALQQIPDWQGLYDYLMQDSNLYQSPILLTRFAQACLHCQKPGFFYWTWGLLFERFSDIAESLLAEHGRLILQEWDDFLAFDQDWPAECFLGFLLIQQPGLIHLYENLPADKSELIKLPVNRAVYDLVKIRLAEADEKVARETLKKQSPTLLSCYLNKRNWARSRRF